MTLIHRITALEPRGGRYGLGRIVAEADVRPDDWYLTCHFVDDRVMPGTLMYECCAHALRFFLLRMGWVAEADASAFEPAPGIASSLRCRGPVTPRTKIATYEIEIKEVGFGPQPYVLADAMMSADGQRIVRMDNMSMQLTGATQETVAAMWSTVDAAAPREYGRKSILAFAVGKPSEAFGERYRAFDHERFIARLPGPPYSFIDRIRPVAGEPWALHAGAEAEAEYHVPNDAWYFAANRQPSLPYAVLLEAALQPCGWLAAYCGSALHGDGPLHFRNLDGEATLRREVFAGDTLRTRVRLANVSKAGGMIIEQFDISMRSGSETVYEGHTTFGFFPPASLSQQIGIRDAASRRWRRTADDLACARSFDLPDELPLAPDDGAALPDGRGSGLLLPGRAFRMVDRIDALRPDGGPHGLGYVAGSADVDPAAWFFKAHFHQDPVWPGSLGLEALLQLLKVFALEKWPTPAAGHRFTSLAVDRRHRWSYRGQVVPTNRRVVVEAVITACEEQPAPTIRADGLLAVDGVIIYEMKDFALSLVRWDSRCTG
jgi:3-hydroxymyristoyl/3-hydroxydecanoyl-(acyl carrier protein) dehydratase